MASTSSAPSPGFDIHWPLKRSARSLNPAGRLSAPCVPSGRNASSTTQLRIHQGPITSSATATARARPRQAALPEARSAPGASSVSGIHSRKMLRLIASRPRTIPEATERLTVQPAVPLRIHIHASSVTRSAASPSVLNSCANSRRSGRHRATARVSGAAARPAISAETAAASVTAPAISAHSTTRQAAKLRFVAA
jgi:hypothetical protein